MIARTSSTLFLRALATAAEQLLEGVVVERLGHLLVRRREPLLREGVHRRLVVTDVEQIGLGANEVEGAAEEHLVAREAGQVELAGRHEDDTRRGRGEHVFAVAGKLDQRDEGLAGRAEVDQRLPHFLHLAPQGRRLDGAQQDAGDARIGLGRTQGLRQAAHRDRLVNQRVEGIVRDFLEVALDLQRPARPWRARRAGRRNATHDKVTSAADASTAQTSRNTTTHTPRRTATLVPLEGRPPASERGAGMLPCPDQEDSTRILRDTAAAASARRAGALYFVVCDRPGHAPLAEVAELADAQVSGTCRGNSVRVQVPPSAPNDSPAPRESRASTPLTHFSRRVTFR